MLTEPAVGSCAWRVGIVAIVRIIWRDHRELRHRAAISPSARCDGRIKSCTILKVLKLGRAIDDIKHVATGLVSHVERAVVSTAVISGPVAIVHTLAIIGPSDAVRNQMAQDVVVCGYRATRGPRCRRSAKPAGRSTTVIGYLWSATRKTSEIRHIGLRSCDVVPSKDSHVVRLRIWGKIAIVIYCGVGGEIRRRDRRGERMARTGQQAADVRERWGRGSGRSPGNKLVEVRVFPHHNVQVTPPGTVPGCRRRDRSWRRRSANCGLQRHAENLPQRATTANRA